MDLKKKLLSFIADKREAGKTPEEENGSEDWDIGPGSMKFKEHATVEFTQDPRVDKEAIESINPSYFEDEEFDAVEYKLQNLPEKLDLQQIEDDRGVLKTQLQAVNRKVSELVLENHPAYATELQHVMELQQSLHEAVGICQNGRSNLRKAKIGFTSTSLNLLANYRKRQQLIALLQSLHTIKTLQRTDIRLRELLEEEDYSGAIQLCLECQKAASTYRHYTCISELSYKLQDTLEMTDEAMDVALSKTCCLFDEEAYSRIQNAYRLLGKTQVAIDQLHMHFTSSIHNTAFTKILGYVELCSGTGDGNFQKRQYSDLCKFIKPEVFIPCLIDLCKALWEVLKSYHKTIRWHQLHDKELCTRSAEVASNGQEGDTSLLYIQNKLDGGLTRIWGDVQQKVKIYLLSTDLSNFKYDEFIQVLDIVNRLINVGDEFCGSKSEGLEDSIRKQSVNYFRSYHRMRMDELRMFLENEGWELCPVKSGFTIQMLQEFKFLRLRGTSASNNEENKDSGSTGKLGFFEKFETSGSPFDFQPEDDESEDVLEVNGYSDDISAARSTNNNSDSDDDIPDELKQDYVDERTGELPQQKNMMFTRRRSYRALGKQPPIVTNTTLNVCRLFGKYMQMMLVLKPIAFNVICYMSQLIDYYLYAVYTFFTAETDLITGDLLSAKFRTTLKRIQENLIQDETQLSSGSDGLNPPTIVSPTIGDDRFDKVAHPHISPAVDLNQPNELFGLSSRVVATESLVFLIDQFKLLQDQLDNAMPTAKKAFLQQYHSQTLSIAPEIRRPVYHTVAFRSVNTEKCVQMMTSVKWDVKDIMSQHSSYVDVLLQEIQLFQGRLEAVSKHVPIPTPVNHSLWEHVIRVANYTFVEGFASAKKCTNEGRALMQLDFQQFLIKLEKLTDLRPIPGREYVETYVKAYYLPEAQLESWIHDHKDYTGRQLIALINCLGHISKKSRQKLISIIEEIDRTKR